MFGKRRHCFPDDDTSIAEQSPESTSLRNIARAVFSQAARTLEGVKKSCRSAHHRIWYAYDFQYSDANVRQNINTTTTLTKITDTVASPCFSRHFGSSILHPDFCFS